VSQALPRTPAALNAIPGLPASLARRYGPALIAAVQRALDLPEYQLPVRERGPRQAREPDIEARVERLKLARNPVAERLGLDPGVLCGKPALEAIARANPADRAALGRVDGLRQWQVDVLGEALLAVLRTG
jgi:ribonuclease D